MAVKKDPRDSDSSFSDARTHEQARVDDAAHVGGMAGAFARAFALGPQVLTLQRALLEGMAQSQLVEAERLAARQGMEDERVARAMERAKRFEELGSGVGSGGEVAGRLAQTFQQEGLFHGYVTKADGTPAVGHTVRLELAADKGGRGVERGAAKTDDEGYFRIDLDARKAKVSAKVSPLARWLHTMTEGAEDSAPMAAAEAVQVDGSEANASANALSAVQVLAPSGALVFEDPSPPTFEPLGSEFRYYVLSEAGTGRATPGSPSSRG